MRTVMRLRSHGNVCLFVLFVSIQIYCNKAVEELPCHFFDSKNITDGIRQPDDSIVYEGVIYPIDQYAVVNYWIKKGSQNITVSPYIRGCICKIKSCLRFCCPIGTYLIKENEKNECREHISANNFTANVLHGNETKVQTLDRDFGIVDGSSCERMYIITPDEYQITHVITLELHNIFTFGIPFPSTKQIPF